MELKTTPRQEKTARFFDSIAHRENWRRLDRREREAVESLILAAKIAPGQRVVEPGCGAGRVTRLLSRAVGEAGRVMALDVSPRMIKAARNAPALPAADFEVGSALDLPVEDGWADAVVCMNCFQHFSVKARALKEMWRVLRPGGRLAIGQSETLDEINNREGRPLEVADNRMPGLAGLARLVGASGFTVIDLPPGEDRFLLVARRDRALPDLTRHNIDCEPLARMVNGWV